MRSYEIMISMDSESRNEPRSAFLGMHTWREIQQQPLLWPTTVERVNAAMERLDLKAKLEDARVVITGAGTSAFASISAAAAWPKARAVASTDLLLETERYVSDMNVLLSLARSGNSPESVAVVDRVHRIRPGIPQLAITCNAQGALATSPVVKAVVLDPRANDQSLVMTSSFSNLALAGLCLATTYSMEAVIDSAVSEAERSLTVINQKMKDLACRVEERVLFLSSAPSFGWALEGSLKVLEMTAGRYPAIAETYLGLRHGPMSFVHPNTVVICLLANDPYTRCYELDLVRELREKNIGYLVGICDEADAEAAPLFHDVVPPLAAATADALRTPFEIVGPQLFGYHLSLATGLDPDSPSPSGVINRVVQGVRIYQ
jgi:tagatose-6-phosphate ketose/aldose isomerase